MGAVATCNSWVMWVALNAFLHSAWVAVLFNLQAYQIVCLGMTTNERINWDRYEHLHVDSGPSEGSWRRRRSLFYRGLLQNIVDFWGIGCCGSRKPDETDWTTRYEIERAVEEEYQCV